MRRAFALLLSYQATRPRPNLFTLLSTRGSDVESTQLLDLVRPFPAIQSLYVSERLVSLTAPALRQLVGEKTTVVLLNLRDLFLGGSAISEATQDAIQPLLAARRSSSKPIAVHLWEEGSADW
ncbi:hypothetical protein BC826DRAFT_1190731 [Russula brevipes]|nr:hypothetical protein BC826DRAFT_1190731 [Russula brevipes]